MCRTPRSRPRQAEHAGWEADRALLVSRLCRLGLPQVRDVQLHANRTVLVSLTPRGVLRIHRGYAYAADRTLEAVVTFIRPGANGQARTAARKAIETFPVERYAPRTPGRNGTRRLTSEERRVVAELQRAHADLNRRFFGGRLGHVPIRLSSRMSTRLGEVAVDRTTGRMAEIALNRRHVERDEWREVCETLLHEMVHQWQVESGHVPDHGARFRAKAREVGIVAAARKAVGAPPID